MRRSVQQRQKWMVARHRFGRCLGRGTGRNAPPVLQAFKNVLNGLDQRCAVAYQLVAALGTRVVNRTRYRIHLSPMLGGQSRGNQRAAGNTGLDHQHAERQAADGQVI